MPSFKKNLLQNKLLIVTVALLAAFSWWRFGGSNSSEHKNTPGDVRVSVASARRQDVPVQVSLVGTVVAYETVAIKSRLDSQITEVKFHDGDYVTEGQVLFVLDDRAIKAQIEQMAAALEKEKAQLVNSKLQYERAQKLVKTNAVAQAQVDEAKAAYEAQAAQVTAAQANLDDAKVMLTYTIITAPISGRTGTIAATRGNTVKANDAALVTINQIKPIRVQFAIPQRYYDQVKIAMAQGDGIPVQAKINMAGDTATGKLEYIDNMIDTASGTFAARAVFGNEDEKLWPGMFVNVAMDLGVEKRALTIPAVAVQGDEGKRFVFTVKDKKAVRTPITVSLNNGDIAVVSQGLKDGDEVITDGMLRVTEGAVLDIAPSAENPKP